MSATGETAAPVVENTLIEQDGAIPETVNTDPPAPVAEEPAETAPEAAPEADKPKRTPWYQTRIDDITKARRDAERERDELRERLASRGNGEAPEAPVFDPSQYQNDVNTAAERMMAQKEMQRRSQTVFDSGADDFGRDAFNEKCNIVAAMGAGDSVEFMQIVTDPDIVEDGHKVIAYMADHPDEAQRILALKDNPVKMAAAIAKFAATAKEAPKPLSSAPAPIRPIGGSSKVTEPSENEPIEVWMAKRREQVNSRGGR